MNNKTIEILHNYGRALCSIWVNWVTLKIYTNHLLSFVAVHWTFSLRIHADDEDACFCSCQMTNCCALLQFLYWLHKFISNDGCLLQRKLTVAIWLSTARNGEFGTMRTSSTFCPEIARSVPILENSKTD